MSLPKIAIIIGTRPEIIKMAPVMRAAEELGFPYTIIHSNQHYSANLDKIFFEELDLPQPNYNLNIGSGNQGDQTGRILIEMEKVLIREEPDVVLVEGDTNTVLGGALSASKLHIKVGHVEAGLRSFFRGMPEEINRILTDHCSDYLFAPTTTAQKYLAKEGIPDDRIWVTGNTIVDAVLQNKKIAEERSTIWETLQLVNGQYILLTTHRAENIDDSSRVHSLFQGVNRVAEKAGIPVIYPIHPRAEKQLSALDVKLSDWIMKIEPVGYLDFIKLQQGAQVILTDSGGIQEESCILQVPCVTLRDNTERPETIEVGSNELAGVVPDKIVAAYQRALVKERTWENPYGNGSTSHEILSIIASDFGQQI